MLVDNSIYKNVYKGNGVTTEFPISFPFLENSHVQVIRSHETDATPVTEEVVPTTEYTITGAGVERGGTCIFTIAPPAGTTLAIVRNVPITQLYAYEELDSFPAESHEDALAKLTMICQMLAEQITRALIVGATNDLTPEEILEDFFNKYNSVLELYEKIQIVIGNLFTCSIVPFITVDGQTQYSVGTELPLDPDANNLLLSLGGVLQEPDVAYKILDSSHIEFTSNPGDGLRCWGRTSVSFSNPDIRSIIENAIKRIEEAAQAQIDRIGDELKDFADGETIIIDENGKFSVPVFTQPTESEPGTMGLVPAPEIIDPSKESLKYLGVTGWRDFSNSTFGLSSNGKDELSLKLNSCAPNTNLNSVWGGIYVCSSWTGVPTGFSVGGYTIVIETQNVLRDSGKYESGGIQIYIDTSGRSAIRYTLATLPIGETPITTYGDWNIFNAPKPQIAEGVGQFIQLWNTTSVFTLPDKGVWVYFTIEIVPSTGIVKRSVSNIAAGGTVLTAASGALMNGWAWRIA